MKKINIDGTEYVIESDAQEVDYSGNVPGATNVKDALDALQHAVEIGGGAGDMSQYGYFGTNFPKQMSLIRSILDMDKNGWPRLRFVHISDTHGTNTGDAVEGSYADDESRTHHYNTLKGKMLAIDKPFYLTLGNHDHSEAPSLDACYTKYLQPLAEHNNLEDNGKTYYSVNYTKSSSTHTSKFKCIFLDQTDCDSVSGGDTAGYWSVFKMSDAQLLWLHDELQEAITNGRHVLIFMHVAPARTTNRKEGWYDEDWPVVGTTLMEMVKAFKTGGSYTRGGTTYSFSGTGVFVAYFCGHNHCDSYGYLQGYENQFCCTTCRPYPNWDADDAMFKSSYNRVNYFTVDYADRKLSLYRVGEQRTWQGTERVSFYIKY